MLKLGIVGTSAIAREMLDAVAGTDGIAVAALCSRSQEKARELARERHIPAYYASYDAMLAWDGIDAVYLATPNSLHVSQALAALEAGKHVICEKPLCTVRGEAERLFAQAEARGRFLFEAITPPYLPNVLRAKELLPKLGQVTEVRCTFAQYSSRYQAYLDGNIPNVFNPAFQGGVLNDLGVYPLHLLLALFGPPEGISYAPELGPNGVDLAGTLWLDYPAFRCTVFCSKKESRPCGCTVRGERGTLQLAGALNECPGGGSLLTEGSEAPFQCQDGRSRLCYELAAFRDAIEGDDRALYRRMKARSILGASLLECAHASF